MTNQTKDNPGVIAPPPAIYFGGCALGLLLNSFFPFPIFVPRIVGISAGILLILIAGTIVSLAFRAFRNHKTNVEPWKPTTAIVTDSIYGKSRNPIYLGLTFLYVGAALLLDSSWILLLLAPVLFLMHFGVIFREETYLEQKFGAEYLDYKRRVRRWL